ncbi:hypothetical protein [Auraticoccus monumenti]|uniref:SnoaL-like domain-containing protein n=1 Tax=Auraticoccus monumenti TaxID=675864 RepID=A0A1G7CQ42_9ACTN|nr:hypothetical protein [Auraticoccus monumenti]SDE41343.1 hypothetical protein SAMN04489747_3339 [Auraticoccus monumenti]
MGTDSPGRRLASALAAKDAGALRAVLTDDVDFTGLTPRRSWSAGDPDEVLDVLLGHWFAPEDEVEELLDVSEGAPVEDTRHVAYRLRLTTPDGARTAEQQVYYRTDGERISYLRVLCSGFRPAPG